MTEPTPMVLTSQEHRELHQRWEGWKDANEDRVRLAYSLFARAERSVLAFGPHLDGTWINKWQLHEDVYGPIDPVDDVLEVMLFPQHNPPMVDRAEIMDCVKRMIVEHEKYGSDGLYMPRSVILGWIAKQHDLIRSDIEEAA